MTGFSLDSVLFTVQMSLQLLLYQLNQFGHSPFKVMYLKLGSESHYAK